MSLGEMDMKVLLVDDDQIDRELVKKALLKADLTVQIDEATSVDQGLGLCSQNAYDVVLLDYQLPQRIGTEMIIELRENRDNNTTIVMMSSSEDEALSLTCIRAGA